MVGKRRSSKDNAVKTAIGITATAVTASIGAGVVTKAGGNPGGLTAFSSFLPTVGAIGGGVVVTRGLGRLQRVTRQRRRR